MRICRNCGREKERTTKNTRPFYYCFCAAWKVILTLLDKAREKHRKET